MREDRSVAAQLGLNDEPNLDNAATVGGEPGAVKQLVDEGIAAAAAAAQPMDIAAAQQRIQWQRANAMLRTAFEARRKASAEGVAGPAKPTGVRMQSHNGITLDVYDDGSHRKEWKRNPELSGRQFRKLRKQANRAWRERQRKAQEAISDANPQPSGPPADSGN